MTDSIEQIQFNIRKLKEEIRVKKEFELYTRSLTHNDLDKHIKKHIQKMIGKIEENEYEN